MPRNLREGGAGYGKSRSSAANDDPLLKVLLDIKDNSNFKMDFSNPRDMEIAVDDPKDQKGLRRIKYDPNWYDKNHKGRLSTCSLAVANFALFVFAI